MLQKMQSPLPKHSQSQQWPGCVKLRREKGLNFSPTRSSPTALQLIQRCQAVYAPPPKKKKLSLNWNIPHSPDMALSTIKVHLQGMIFQDIDGTENCEVGTACYS
jgi:hypothetical protein